MTFNIDKKKFQKKKKLDQDVITGKPEDTVVPRIELGSCQITNPFFKHGNKKIPVFN